MRVHARTAAGDEEDVAVGDNTNDKPELTSFGDAGGRHFETGAVRECGLVFFRNMRSAEGANELRCLPNCCWC